MPLPGKFSCPPPRRERIRDRIRLGAELSADLGQIRRRVRFTNRSPGSRIASSGIWVQTNAGHIGASASMIARASFSARIAMQQTIGRPPASSGRASDSARAPSGLWAAS